MSSSGEPNYHGRIVFTLGASLQKDRAASDFVRSISGRIFGQQEADGREKKSGYVNASLVQFGSALEHGITAAQLGDGISGAISEYWEELFDVESGRWKDEIRDEFEIAGSDLLIIDSIELHPILRGHGLGLAAVLQTIELFGSGCGLVACKPWPLQFTPMYAANRRSLQRLQPPAFNQDESVRKLRLHWAKAGFWPYGGAGLYVMSLSQQ